MNSFTLFIVVIAFALALLFSGLSKLILEVEDDKLYTDVSGESEGSENTVSAVLISALSGLIALFFLMAAVGGIIELL